MVDNFMKIIVTIVAIALIFSCNSGSDIKTEAGLPANFSYRYDKNSGVTHIQLDAEVNDIRINALFDTGNSLYDPISLLPVMLIEKDAITNIL